MVVLWKTDLELLSYFELLVPFPVGLGVDFFEEEGVLVVPYLVDFGYVAGVGNLPSPRVAALPFPTQLLLHEPLLPLPDSYLPESLVQTEQLVLVDVYMLDLVAGLNHLDEDFRVLLRQHLLAVENYSRQRPQVLVLYGFYGGLGSSLKLGFDAPDDFHGEG